MKPASSASCSPPEAARAGRRALILLAAVVVSAAGYLLASALTLRLGFPLDDSWIHQTYARNLALRGEWAFVPGEPSGGSTAPLWTALLAIGFWLHLSPYAWTYLLGAVLLFVLAFQVEVHLRRLVERYRSAIPWAGLLIVFEWHLGWAAFSGMETLLHALLIFQVLTGLMAAGRRHWLGLGILTGISLWVRPDGLTLLGPLLFAALLTERGWRLRWRALASALLGFALFLALYLLFNLTLTGAVMPNTFYAKQAEYASWQARPLGERLGEVGLQFLSGPSLILLPGFILAAASAIRRRDGGQIAALLWMFGYLALYLMRLPAYQHGRYYMPAMPVYFFFGMTGCLGWLGGEPLWRGTHWRLRAVWAASLLLVGAAFWGLGIRAYGEDVRFIETDMVETARWMAANLSPDSLVAVHDIGAVGYFAERRLVDLAGLVSPEVIPFIRDEERLAAYLDARGVDYLVAFPDWYPLLTSGLPPVFVAGSPGDEAVHMTVYRWRGR
ncbi:MAG: hypothetical protein ABWK53_04455 [Anaerolineales bacterium]